MRLGKITKQPFGHNAIAQFPKKIAAFLRLKNIETFTGHCFRRTAATLLANSGGDVLQLKRLGGWKSSTVAEGYVDSSSQGQEQIAHILSTTHGQELSPTVSYLSTSTTSTKQYNFSKEQLKDKLSFTVNCHDHSNVTINVNK